METVSPDLVIVFGIRTILALLGIVTAATAFWFEERKWDEEGVEAYNRSEGINQGDYQAPVEEGQKKYVTNSDGSRDAISVCTEDFQETVPTNIPKVELEALKPFPKVMIAGVVVWALSFLFEAEAGFSVYAHWNICFVILLPVIALIVAYPIRTATIERNLEARRKAITVVILISVFLTVSAILDSGSDAPWYFMVGGVVSLFVSYQIMRRSKKMGLTFDMAGEPYLNVPVQSLGPLTFIFGLFLVLAGTNGQAYAYLQNVYIPIYVGYRSILVFVAGLVIIVPSLLALDMAFDQGSAVASSYSLSGNSMREASRSITFMTLEPVAASLETPWLFLFGWVFLGVTAFMPFGFGFTLQKLFASLLCVMVGGVYGLLVLPAYWKADKKEYQKWTYVYYILKILLCTAIGFGGTNELIMAVFGAILIFVGQSWEMSEKKKGNAWLESQQENPNTVVFGYGHPIYIVGWILFCLAMAVPM
eukprot:Nitzschia sp. Nitz4//scaffold358_size24170//1680//3175//NITZ4_008428-RA/size24170-augustus-gene-0.43-mRNA-1//1//CDS//3329548993//5870//frame0